MIIPIEKETGGIKPKEPGQTDVLEFIEAMEKLAKHPTTEKLRVLLSMGQFVDNAAAEQHIKEDGYESVSAGELIYWAYQEEDPDKSRKLLKRARIIELRYRRAPKDKTFELPVGPFSPIRTSGYQPKPIPAGYMIIPPRGRTGRV